MNLSPFHTFMLLLLLLIVSPPHTLLNSLSHTKLIAFQDMRNSSNLILLRTHNLLFPPHCLLNGDF